MFIDLKLRDDEAAALRELLTQTNKPGSLQSSLILRIDAAIESEKRPRFHTQRKRIQRREHFLVGH